MRAWFRNSLLSKYMLIILGALVLLPATFILVPILMFLSIDTMGGDSGGKERYESAVRLEAMWHREAAKLGGASPETITRELAVLQERYPEAGMLYVDAAGATRVQLPVTNEYPEVWTSSYSIRFMKERINGDPFTVVAFLGEAQEEGFLIFELPREYLKPQGGLLWESHGTFVMTGMLLIIAAFLSISFLFFNQIRRRLVRMQKAMTEAADHGLPGPITVQNEDEIGRLEATFNDMVRKLEDSRTREAGEEALRRDLIAKLSHDLRTPLTTIRGHAYSLRGEKLSDRGIESTRLIESKIDHLSRLIDNLFSYSLLAAGKYPYQPRSVEMVRTVRTLFASWYPVFEQAGFTMDLDVDDKSVYWQVDPAWLERVLDNYLQNVLRHASSGRYIGLHVTSEHGGAIIITDHGPGMTGESPEKGAGLGLSIISLMLKEMRLKSSISSKTGETIIRISPKAHAGGVADSG
ncbi:sensor histidine kinase [Paenibacillus puerhi]|uniref:sensor histidine kinase n=1 Tax=Paenibacillus puerhi TaxID=2692622 RepID=UPI0013586320|nr:HAMP domain-containing sensor histidine kinase [Paenibacillus puerhi]